MRLYRQYTSVTEAENIAERLEKRGIPSHVSGKHSMQLSGYLTGTLKVGLWIVLNEQYEDAVKVINNPGYRPRNTLSPEELERVKAQATLSARDRMAEASITFLLAIPLIAFLMFLLARNLID